MLPDQGSKNKCEKSSCDAMYIKKWATADAVLVKVSNPEKMNLEQPRKVL